MADRWIEAGRPNELLTNNRHLLMALKCWTFSGGAVKEGVPSSVMAFKDACLLAMSERAPGWYEALLSERTFCESCGERYRTENLSICTMCLGQKCTWCALGRKAPNGNPECGCGGEYVG